ncbi:ABC transporter ATP-binding protein [Syntrophomonas wolfei]|jgi:ABC-2 type transport system ATP-binding protein|uniref:ABC transporter ATP-binding protein n=1 Tax=Syntrophomonas wolfei TaxID=863 RepID=UPI000774ADCD|nr:ABC transporter ATP-binding protein [Syntrophomonas wolfei]
MIKVLNLCKSFDGFQALHNVNVTVPKGSVYGIVGPNGSGKTTLIKHMVGILIPDQGTIKIDENEVFDNPAVKKRIAYIPDDIYFFLQDDMKDMINSYRRVYPAFNDERLEKLIPLFPLDPKMPIRRFSRGMKKHVAFIMALCSMPDVLVLDEPMDGLDPVARRKVWSLLFQDIAERETTVFVSSHNLRELEDVCDHVGIMHRGEVVLERSLDELQNNIFKLQMAFRNESPDFNSLNVLAEHKVGSVIQLVVRGERKEILDKAVMLNPLMIDVLPLSLEEIFIHELGGMDYAISSAII